MRLSPVRMPGVAAGVRQVRAVDQVLSWHTPVGLAYHSVQPQCHSRGRSELRRIVPQRKTRRLAGEVTAGRVRYERSDTADPVTASRNLRKPT